MVTGFLALLILMMKLWPATPAGRCLHRAFVEIPLELAGLAERRHLILIGLLMFGGQLVVVLGPELAFAYAMDLSLYGEAVIATALATAAVRVRYVWQKLVRLKKIIGLHASGGRRARPRSRRTRARTALQNNSANDDEHAGAGSLRAA